MTLYPLEPEDLELLYTIENDRSLWWVGSQTAPVSRYHLRDYIANNSSDIYRDEQVRFAIHDSQGGVTKSVGLLDLFNFSPRNRRVEFGIALLNDAQGRGLAQKAISEMVEYCRTVISVHQIVAIVPVGNDQSLNMLRRAGFSTGLVLQDWVWVEDKYEDCMLMQLFL